MKKVLKVGGIVLGIIVVLVIIFVTTFSILKKNGLINQKMGSSLEISDDYERAVGMERPSSASLKNSSFDADGVVSEEIAPSTEKKVIKNGNITAKVERVAEAQEKISAVAKNNGGDIFSSNIRQSQNNIKNGTITVKVPVDNFEKTFREIKDNVSLVLRESMSGQDITEKYMDLEARIKNKQAEERSYAKILDKAQKIEDILAITKQLSTVRGEIERLQGQLKYLASQTDMSTITISLSEDQDITAVDSWRPLQIAKDAANALIKMVQGFVGFIIVLVITLVPVAILYLLLIYIIFLIIRKIYRKLRNRANNS